MSHYCFRFIVLLFAWALSIPVASVAAAELQETLPPPQSDGAQNDLEYRRWTTSPFGVQRNLALVRYELGRVYLRSSAGDEHSYLVEQLGPLDQEWVDQYLDTLWARIVLDERAMEPTTIEWIELFGSGDGNSNEGPFAQGVAPMQMGGDPLFTLENLSRRYGVPEQRTMDNVEGPERNVKYIVYGPIAIGAKPDDDEEVWVRVDRNLARQGLTQQAEIVLGRDSE